LSPSSGEGRQERVMPAQTELVFIIGRLLQCNHSSPPDDKDRSSLRNAVSLKVNRGMYSVQITVEITATHHQEPLRLIYLVSSARLSEHLILSYRFSWGLHLSFFYKERWTV
jgi:hypothetical protein